MNKTPLFSEINDVKMHIALLWQIASADGVILPQEEGFIKNVLDIYSAHSALDDAAQLFEEAKAISAPEIKDWKTALCGQPVAARNLIKDLIVLAYIDQDFCESEKNQIYEIASSLGISNENADEIANAVWNVMDATNKLNHLIFVS